MYQSHTPGLGAHAACGGSGQVPAAPAGAQVLQVQGERRRQGQWPVGAAGTTAVLTAGSCGAFWVDCGNWGQPAPDDWQGGSRLPDREYSNHVAEWRGQHKPETGAH